MKGRGVITIFLSLVLLLFMNFIMTSIEAARITAGRSYLEMLGINAGRALEGRYYYPLFEQYGLLAVDGGRGSSQMDYNGLLDSMEETLSFAVENTAGGLIGFEDSSITDLRLTTLTSNGYEAFKNQVKEQALYEGAELLCDFLKDDSLETVSKVAKLESKLQESAEATSVVSIEILKLMELVDGVCTNAEGLATDKKGNYLVADSFAKKLCGVEPATLEASYGDRIIYDLLKDYFFYPRDAAESMLALLENYKNPGNLEDPAGLEQTIRIMYGALKEVSIGSTEAFSKALEQAQILEKAQMLAQSSVLEYEEEVLKSGLEGSLLSGLLEDLESLKDYVGLNDSGYNAKAMKTSLQTDINILQTAALPEENQVFLEEYGINTELLENSLAYFIDMLSTMTYDYLCFDYGNLQASNNTELLTGGLREIFSGDIFELLGVSQVSERSINGADLPSRGKSDSQSGDILDLFKEISREVSSGNISQLLKNGYESLSSDFLTEVYLTNHFADFRDASNGSSKIFYEREYILKGHKKDSENLLAVAMSLIALRAVFCFTALLTDAGRNQEATALAQTMAVFGHPALVYVAKYLILTVWAIEEAVVEVSALLAGKSIPVFNPSGNLQLYELLILSPELVKSKVENMGTAASGVGYNAYITILSFLQSTSEKNGRALDLIQENIRYRYRDSFRIGNCITGADYTLKGSLEKRFSAGFFTDEAYEIDSQLQFAY